MNSNSGQDREIADTKFKLANVWQLKGNFARARARYQEVLKIQSNYFPAYVQLGHLMCRQKNLTEAAAYYDRALEINFAEVDLSFYYQVLGLSYIAAIAQEKESKSDRQIEDNVRGKINLNQQKGFDFHRHGWGLALDTLGPLHNSQGIKFDGCLEDTFLYQQNLATPRSQRLITKMKEDGVFKYLGTLVEKEIVPYTKPWVGFIHNPPYVPDWFKHRANPSDMFEQPFWQESLKHCLGIFCLSQYQTAWLQKKVDPPVVNLIHPTEISELQFNFNSFLSNSQKKIVQVGWWLRKLNSIEQLPIAQGNQLGYIKVRLVPNFAQNADEQLEKIMLAEREISGLEILPEYAQNTVKVQHLVNDEYDRLLAENLVLIDLHDAGANTAILDCLARATPVLVNPLPAVQEYLGTEYPFYFRDLAEAAAKAMDLDLIKASHLYLQKWQLKTEFSASYFLSSFKQSVIYKSI